MRTFGLIGFPLSHSFSKKFFTDKFETESIRDCLYENFPIRSIDELPLLFNKYPTLKGLNITIPYKQDVISFLYRKHPVVERIGACNCIKVIDGHWYGFNTDVIGFERSLKEKLLPHHKTALILGTGGAAKAVMYVLETLGIAYLLVSRVNESNDPGKITYDELTSDVIAGHPLVINTTPLGMYPNVDEYPPIHFNTIGPAHYLYDLTYNPTKTAFLREGENRGALIKNGMDMLVIQAEESWRIWNDPDIATW